MAKKVFTDESLSTFVDEIKAYTDDAVSGKANTSHTHSYAGSSSVGGAATSANKLNTNAGSVTQPVYFANGVPVVTTYTLGKSVPSNAVFTDTDTKMTQTVSTTSANYPLLLAPSGQTATATTTGYFGTKFQANPSTGVLTATTFSGSGASLTSLNASNISSGTLAAARLATSGVTAGSYGQSANAAPAHSGTFSVPYITVDAYGRVTSASTKTVTLPSDNNTDTKVTNTLGTTTKYYITGTTSASTNTGTQYFDTGIYSTTTAGQLRVTSLNIGDGAILSYDSTDDSIVISFS